MNKVKLFTGMLNVYKHDFKKLSKVNRIAKAEPLRELLLNMNSDEISEVIPLLKECEVKISNTIIDIETMVGVRNLLYGTSEEVDYTYTTVNDRAGDKCFKIYRLPLKYSTASSDWSMAMMGQVNACSRDGQFELSLLPYDRWVQLTGDDFLKSEYGCSNPEVLKVLAVFTRGMLSIFRIGEIVTSNVEGKEVK